MPAGRVDFFIHLPAEQVINLVWPNEVKVSNKRNKTKIDLSDKDYLAQIWVYAFNTDRKLCMFT